MFSIRATILLICLKLLQPQLLLMVHGLHPEFLLNFEERVKLHGYPIEIHQVTTKDDYMLNIYRIPYGLEKTSDDSKNKSVVFLIHGMAGSPHNFIILGKNYSPAYYFANRSFDVWVFCSRGVDCQNSKKHKRYDWNRDPEYWNYSLHEIGIYDLSVSIDYIIKVTGQQKIFCVGHSAAGPELLILNSERPEYNNKIKISVHYAHGSSFEYFDFPLLSLTCEILSKLKNFFNDLGVHELLTHDIQQLVISFCKRAFANPQLNIICSNGIQGFSGSYKSILIEKDTYELAFSTFPRLSIRQAMQFADNVNGGGFRKYDWGLKKNKKLYGQKLPPLYNMSSSTHPKAFFYGATDSFSTPKDTLLTMDTLSNVIMDCEVGPRFTHLDFIFAKNATHMVYEPTVKLFKDFDEGKVSSKTTRTKRVGKKV